jgi:plastocyanin
MKVLLAIVAAGVLFAAAPALAKSGTCQCGMSAMAGATGLTLTSGPATGPCGRPIVTGDAATASTSASSSGMTISILSAANASADEAVAGAAASNTDVSVESSSFNPNFVTINQGDTVTWNWTFGGTHTVTSDTGLFDSGFLSSGSYSYTFNDAGTFGYYCQLHGSSGFGGNPGFGMWGQVTVNAVPEPVTTGLLLLPGALLLGRRRRR